MKIDCVITSVNLNDKYSQFIPLFIKSWGKLLPHIDIKIILINERIPDKLNEYKNNIILFKPIENMHTAFIAQYIRILYPAILNYKNGILISDMDMIPMNDFYYNENIKNISDDQFIIFRDVIPKEYEQYPICYNIATNKVWSDIFKINSIEDINKRLKQAYSEINYGNTHGGSGWDKDQRDLYSFVLNYKNKVILNDNRCKFFNKCVEKFGIDKCISYGSCYGKYKKTNKICGGDYQNPGLIKNYSNCKFVIAMENSIGDGYVTEKIVNVFYSGAIPIYWGSSNINDLFNKDAFININDFKNLDECIEHISNLSEKDINYILNQNIYNDNDLINIFNDEYNKKNNNLVLKEYNDKVNKFIQY